jgi:hypothetical protein
LHRKSCAIQELNKVLEQAPNNISERIEWFRKSPRLASVQKVPGFQRIINSVESRLAAK